MRLAMILKDDEHTGVKKGELFYCNAYQDDKVILFHRVNDGYDPECTEYLNNIKIINVKNNHIIARIKRSNKKLNVKHNEYYDAVLIGNAEIKLCKNIFDDKEVDIVLNYNNVEFIPIQ